MQLARRVAGLSAAAAGDRVRLELDRAGDARRAYDVEGGLGGGAEAEVRRRLAGLDDEAESRALEALDGHLAHARIEGVRHDDDHVALEVDGGPADLAVAPQLAPDSLVARRVAHHLAQARRAVGGHRRLREGLDAEPDFGLGARALAAARQRRHQRDRRDTEGAATGKGVERRTRHEDLHRALGARRLSRRAGNPDATNAGPHAQQLSESPPAMEARKLGSRPAAWIRRLRSARRYRGVRPRRASRRW